MITDGAKPEPRTQAEQAHTLVKVLRTVPGLAPCDQRTLLEIVGDSVNLVWPRGHIVFDLGTPPNGLFIVLSGRVRVLRDGGVKVAELGPGEHFGELSLLTGTMHQHAVETLEDSELMVVPKERFDSLLAENPELAAGIRQQAEARMRANLEHGD
ncbi:MAG TPA: cyclic nucleotide-binding domain-containing protein [Gaiellaceae bacterium]